MLDQHQSERDEALAARQQWANAGKCVVFTNGCFDLLHAGHVAYLQWARDQGDILVVGLNNDASVKKLKGLTRPVIPYAQRKLVLEALRAVDLVVGFAELTPEYLIELLYPNVHVKSEQYTLDDLPERAIVEAGGGRVALAPHHLGLSTTDILARIHG